MSELNKSFHDHTSLRLKSVAMKLKNASDDVEITRGNSLSAVRYNYQRLKMSIKHYFADFLFNFDQQFLF